ncbi:hypothetical protein [Streptacidiphilus sp. P02-A3a]|uniref:hypothetical protein n=1 Tax=Streptacidiphilus sp. P02-A3a TaxID=2704468 RepID=UPI0015F7D733|nr:hypothetical protein [Streptacidiphilus sp. P02-A3a]QMU67965.1 hypothetical protein GXP74_06750 [Streptacidiphilus sp. P02-A3a]
MTQQRNQDEDIAIVRLAEGPGLREDEIDGWYRPVGPSRGTTRWTDGGPTGTDGERRPGAVRAARAVTGGVQGVTGRRWLLVRPVDPRPGPPSHE